MRCLPGSGGENVLSRRASAELLEIEKYLEAHSPKGAQNVLRAIAKSLDNLAMFPKIGKRRRKSKMHRRIVKKYRHMIYYRIDNAADEIAILTIQHPARAREHADD